MAMQPWKTIARRKILGHGKYLLVEDHSIVLPNGKIIQNWPWVVSPDYVNVVAVTETGEFLFFRQTKYAVSGDTLAPVGGYIEASEEPLAAAKRELHEEMGCESSDWIDLGSFVVDGNHGEGTAHLFLASNARQVATPHSDDLEEQLPVRMSREEAERALANGEFKVLAWATCVALALRNLQPALKPT
jgi:ADP-ribose pyrophosphatase